MQKNYVGLNMKTWQQPLSWSSNTFYETSKLVQWNILASSRGVTCHAMSYGFSALSPRSFAFFEFAFWIFFLIWAALSSSLSLTVAWFWPLCWRAIKRGICPPLVVDSRSFLLTLDTRSIVSKLMFIVTSSSRSERNADVTSMPSLSQLKLFPSSAILIFKKSLQG